MVSWHYAVWRGGGRPAPGLVAGALRRAQPQPPPPLPPIHIVLSACGNPSPREPEYFGLLAIKSLLMARAQTPARASQAYSFHIVTDVSEEELFGAFKLNFDVRRLVEAEPALLSMHVYQASAVEASVGELGLPHASALPLTIFKSCAAARLKIPFFLPSSVEKAIYLDWDTAVMCDLTELWGGGFAALEAAPGAVVGLALNDPTGLSTKNTYRKDSLLNFPYPALGGVNSGVMLWHLGRIRESGLPQWWRAVTAVVARYDNLSTSEYWSLTKAFPLGDQDILNVLLSKDFHPEWLHVIPSRYNSCLVDALPPQWLEKAGIKREIPCIVHFCGSRLFQATMREDSFSGEPSVQDKASRALYDYLATYLILDSATADNHVV